MEKTYCMQRQNVMAKVMAWLNKPILKHEGDVFTIGQVIFVGIGIVAGLVLLGLAGNGESM